MPRTVPLSEFGNEVGQFCHDHGYKITELSRCADVPYASLNEARTNDYVRKDTQAKVRAFMEEVKNKTVKEE